MDKTAYAADCRAQSIPANNRESAWAEMTTYLLHQKPSVVMSAIQNHKYVRIH